MNSLGHSLLVEELAGLNDTGVKERPILHDKLDVLNGQIDEHTSDLGGLGSNDLGDVLVKNGTDLVLVVGVLGNNGGDNLMASNQVALLDGHLGHLLLLDLLLLGHLLLLHDLLLSHGVLGSHRVHDGAGVLLTRHLLVHAWGSTVSTGHAVVVTVLTTVVGAHTLLSGLATLVTTAVISRGTTWATHGALLLLHEVRHGLKEHLEVELELFLVGKIGPLGALGVCLSELLEIVLIASSLVLDFANLLDLVMVDGQSLVVDSEVLLGGRGLIWLLEADESVKLLDTLTRGVHLEALNLTVLGEETAEFILCPGVGETLNVEVASLL